MRLAHKLSVAQMGLIAAVLVGHAGFRFRREVRLFENDMRRDQHVTGHAIAGAVSDIWKAGGSDRALGLIRDANAAESSVRIGWLQLADASATAPLLTGDIASWATPLLQGKETVRVEDGKPGSLTTYIPITIDGLLRGAVTVSESLGEQRRFIQTTILHMIVTTTVIGLGAILISIVLGSAFIVQPMGALVNQARRVGSGDLSNRIDLRHRDEIGELAKEMNLMCDRLEEMQDRLLAETEARISMLEQLRHADRLAAAGTISSGIAHELGTPLNVVMGRAKMIESGSLGLDETLDNARIIREQAERISKIIRQLLDFSRHGVSPREPADLRHIAAQMLSLLTPIAEKHSARISMPDGDGSACPVLIDANQIRQVLANLVLNGIQAMPNGGNLTVRVDSRPTRPPADHGGPEATYVCLEIEDEGVGIAPDCLPRVFDPFFTTKPIGEGTGLGLWVSYRIVRDHGGWIEAESAMQRGSRFRVYLPWKEAESMVRVGSSSKEQGEEIL
jgi:two-component system, NtrC family, sensor kinase